MEEKQFKELNQKIDTIVKLLGINVINNFKTNKDKISFLSNLELDPKSIISITGIPSKTVYNVISELRKKEEVESKVKKENELRKEN